MNSYDYRCATFGITEKVRGLPVTASDAYELVRRSVCDFRHYGKSARTASYGSWRARALTAWRVLARASTSDRSASSPGAFSTRRAADRRLAHDQARPCIATCRLACDSRCRWPRPLARGRCVMPGVAVVHFSPSRTSRPVGRRPTARSVDRGAALTSSRATDRWCFPARLPDGRDFCQ
ncbi:unnamed protein product [Trichogramma brassicae]|uniref:Uncharacterized protein n=1 Tax=Trichogramma brassicae TaxID=86971 RepID=A0A6H5II63_9HYME|nr:unnamed protein product [Trichogramma brassicae]